jgi:hypothetical protein
VFRPKSTGSMIESSRTRRGNNLRQWCAAPGSPTKVGLSGVAFCDFLVLDGLEGHATSCSLSTAAPASLSEAISSCKDCCLGPRPFSNSCSPISYLLRCGSCGVTSDTALSSETGWPARNSQQAQPHDREQGRLKRMVMRCTFEFRLSGIRDPGL